MYIFIINIARLYYQKFANLSLYNVTISFWNQTVLCFDARRFKRVCCNVLFPVSKAKIVTNSEDKLWRYASYKRRPLNLTPVFFWRAEKGLGKETQSLLSYGVFWFRLAHDKAPATSKLMVQKSSGKELPLLSQCNDIFKF